MPVYWTDLLAGTTHMDAAELGGFMLLIAEQWKRGHLPNDNRKLKKIARISSQLKMNTILEKFTPTPDGHLVNEVCAKVRVEQREKFLRQHIAGKKNAKKRWQTDTNGNANGTTEEEKKEERDTNVSNHHQQAGHDFFAEKIFSVEGELDKQHIELEVRRPITPNDCTQFNAHCAFEERTHLTFSEWKKHFRNWLTTKPQTHEPPKTRKQRTGANTATIVSAADSILQQYASGQHTAGTAEQGQHTGYT